MKELFGNLCEFDGIIVITTNGFVKRDGTCVIKFSGLPHKLGTRISAEGNRVFYFPEHRLITFPVKHTWWEAADLGLIRGPQGNC